MCSKKYLFIAAKQLIAGINNLKTLVPKFIFCQSLFIILKFVLKNSAKITDYCICLIT